MCEMFGFAGLKTELQGTELLEKKVMDQKMRLKTHRIQLLRISVCQDKEGEFETGSHQRAISRDLTLSYLCIKKIILTEMKESNWKRQSRALLFKIWSSTSSVLSSPASLLEM